MFGSSALGAAIGLAFVFFLVAMMCSAIVEWWANLSRKRAKYLLRGLRDLLDAAPKVAPRRSVQDAMKGWSADHSAEVTLYDKAMGSGTDGLRGDTWVEQIMGHPLVGPLKQSRAGDGQTRNPSYLPAGTFAAVLVDILVPDDNGRTTFDDVRTAVSKMPESPLKGALAGLLLTAQNGVSGFMTSVERWYDGAMERVSGSYKRWSKRWLIVLGLAVAVFFQVDTLQIGSTLYSQPPVQNAVVAAATNGTLCPQGKPLEETQTCVRSELSGLKAVAALPVGWSSDVIPKDANVGTWLLKAIGWALTALAASFGAPFWFQALSKLGSLRNTGAPPARVGQSG